MKTHRNSGRMLTGAIPSVLALIAIASHLSSSTCFSETITVEELESSAIRNRERIRNGSFKYFVKASAVSRDPDNSDPVKMDLEGAFYFDMDRKGAIRLDWVQDAPHVAAKDGNVLEIASNRGRHVRRVVVSDDRVLFYSPDEHTDGTTVVGSIDKRDQEKENAEGRKQAFDQRLIGFSPGLFSGLLNKRIDSFVGRPGVNRMDQTLTRDSIDGVDVWRIEYRYARKRGEATVKLWIAPELDFCLLRGEESYAVNNQAMIDSVECTLKWHENGRVWFPAKTVGTRRLDGVLVAGDEVSIEDSEFNVGVDPGVFEFTGLALRRGTPVLDRSGKDGRVLEWDGAELVQRNFRSADASTMEPSDRSWLFVGLNCGVIAIVCFLLYLRSRRTKKV